MIRALQPSKKDKALLVHDKFCKDNQCLPSKGTHTLTTHQTVLINIDTILMSKTINHLEDTRKYRILIKNTVSHPKYIIIRCYKHLNTNTPPFQAHISSSAVLPAWGRFTEHLPKKKHENISNCETKLNTQITVLLNIHGKTGRSRIAIHF